MIFHILFIVVKAFMFFILLYCADKMGLLMVRNSPTAKEETINAHILPSAEK